MKRLTFTENSNIAIGDYLDVQNKKGEHLGLIYYYKPWGCWVWHQDEEAIMSKGCMKEVGIRMSCLDRFRDKGKL